MEEGTHQGFTHQLGIHFSLTSAEEFRGTSDSNVLVKMRTARPVPCNERSPRAKLRSCRRHTACHILMSNQNGSRRPAASTRSIHISCTRLKPCTAGLPSQHASFFLTRTTSAQKLKHDPNISASPIVPSDERFPPPRTAPCPHVQDFMHAQLPKQISPFSHTPLEPSIAGSPSIHESFSRLCTCQNLRPLRPCFCP